MNLQNMGDTFVAPKKFDLLKSSPYCSTTLESRLSQKSPRGDPFLASFQEIWNQINELFPKLSTFNFSLYINCIEMFVGDGSPAICNCYSFLYALVFPKKTLQNIGFSRL